MNRIAIAATKRNHTSLRAVMSAACVTALALFSGARADGDADHTAFLKVHNTARASVGVGNLIWSDSLAAGAQAWASKLAELDTLDHSKAEGAYGENLFSGSEGYTPADAAKDWLTEKDGYSGGAITMENFASVGHYTQMVWSSTTEVGYGVAKSTSGNVYIVARYSPAGNFLGQKPYKEQATKEQAAEQPAAQEQAAEQQAPAPSPDTDASPDGQ
jgi:uncharacterized protein YkwD